MSDNRKRVMGKRVTLRQRSARCGAGHRKAGVLVEGRASRHGGPERAWPWLLAEGQRSWNVGGAGVGALGEDRVGSDSELHGSGYGGFRLRWAGTPVGHSKQGGRDLIHIFEGWSWVLCGNGQDGSRNSRALAVTHTSEANWVVKDVPQVQIDGTH